MNFAGFNRFFKKPLIIIFLLGPFLLTSCIKEKSDPITGKSENEKFEPNSDARARKYADENPIMFFGDRGKKIVLKISNLPGTMCFGELH